MKNNLQNKSEIIRIFVGCDRSQLIAFKTLEHSIKRNTKQVVELKAIDNSMLPAAKGILNVPYTNFSYARFGIPSFTGYKGKAIYLDADMLVFADISKLWELPFNNKKVLLLEQPEDELLNRQSKKRKQTAVMVLDCEKLADWKPGTIIGDLGSKYDRTYLMSLKILEDEYISETIPTEWNCLDWYEEEKTNLLHYTKVELQPWVYAAHKHGDIWLNEIKLMLENNRIEKDFIINEVLEGYVRPSLLLELGIVRIPDNINIANKSQLLDYDKKHGYKPHREVLARDKKYKRKFMIVKSVNKLKGIVTKPYIFSKIVCNKITSLTCIL